MLSFIVLGVSTGQVAQGTDIRAIQEAINCALKATASSEFSACHAALAVAQGNLQENSPEAKKASLLLEAIAQLKEAQKILKGGSAAAVKTVLDAKEVKSKELTKAAEQLENLALPNPTSGGGGDEPWEF
jgi:hypothetical protein